MRHIAIFLISVWVSFTLTDGADDECYTFSKPLEDRLCTFVEKKNRTFCPSSGAADQDCQDIAVEMSGVDAKCFESEVCSFIIDGQDAYVTCNAKKPKYRIQRNCQYNFGIACPNANANLSDTSELFNITGKFGHGVQEGTTLMDHQICNSDLESSLYCSSETLRDDIVLNFHPEKRLGDLCGGVCQDTYNFTHQNDSKETVKCVLGGSYMTESGQRDTCRFYLYNQGSKVFSVAYWGSANLSRLNV